MFRNVPIAVDPHVPSQHQRRICRRAHRNWIVAHTGAAAQSRQPGICGGTGRRAQIRVGGVEALPWCKYGGGVVKVGRRLVAVGAADTRMRAVLLCQPNDNLQRFRCAHTIQQGCIAHQGQVRFFASLVAGATGLAEVPPICGRARRFLSVRSAGGGQQNEQGGQQPTHGTGEIWILAPLY